MKSKEWPWYLYSLLKWILTGRFFFAPQIWNKSSVLSSQDFSSSSKDLLDVLDHYYQDTYIPGLLEVEDRISMAHGLETRVPLWSQDLVSFSKKIPMEKKLQNGVLKYLLKRVAKKWLPGELLSAPKRGFPTPLRKWFRKELFDFVSERLLNSSNSTFYIIFSKQELKEILESHRNNYLPFALDELRAHKIWTALCVESWLRQFRMEVK
jgi:asparagine synthase (glutamine-hydrolysing)